MKCLTAYFTRLTLVPKSGQWQVVSIPFAEFVPTYHGRRLSDDKRMKPGRH